MLKLTTPQIEQRDAQPCVAIRTQVEAKDIGTVLPPLVPEVLNWLKLQGVEQAGPAFFRYLYIDMARKLEIEVGVPTGVAVKGDGRVLGSVIPAGRYVTAFHTGHPAELEAATAKLLVWAETQGVSWDARPEGRGEAWCARFEFYLNGPDDQPDMTKWETQLAFKMADSAVSKRG